MAEAEAQQAVNEQQPQSEEIAEQNQVEQETQEISEVESYKKRIENGNQCMTKQLLTILRCKP